MMNREFEIEHNLTEEQIKELKQMLGVDEPKPRNRAERRGQKQHEWLMGTRGGRKSWVNGQK